MKPIVVKLNKNNNEYQRLINRGKQSEKIHSGYVTLKPGESVGEHLTEEVEEIIVVLEGVAKAMVDKKNSLKASKGSIIYIPRNVFHNIKNIGKKLLKYVYITVK